MRIAILLPLLLVAAGQAYAHAQLRHADPAVGSTVHAPPAQVELTFSEAVEPRFSSISVTDAAGTAVTRGDPHLPADDAHRLAVGLGPIGPGRYKVVWHATSVDTHKTEGVFEFTVAP